MILENLDRYNLCFPRQMALQYVLIFYEILLMVLDKIGPFFGLK